MVQKIHNVSQKSTLSIRIYDCFCVTQANMKLNEQQLASLSSPKAVNEYLESQKENITSVIKQNLAVGDIFRRENLQVSFPL